jgi:hypothetical protein
MDNISSEDQIEIDVDHVDILFPLIDILDDIAAESMPIIESP